MNKKDLRGKVLELRNSISDEEILNRSTILMNKIKKMEVFNDSKTILIYVSFDKEIDTHDMIKDCLKIGKNVVTPICNTKDRTLILGKTSMFPEGFHKTKYGILELDPKECDHVNIKEIDLIIMPGVAFTKKGERLGYGAGYYDKLLAQKSLHTITVAPVFEEFIFEDIPTDKHDMLIDYIISG
ncbi:5-formyltetrahydrofolate cyclo-ligase [Alkalibaculum sporogenes]|uniref:5-formyltetrahydrofolate cyclo-ligase n=1 Tax=Alkalibaculum sporogenes TaxID=2655001 RepID=UPI00128E1583|nr:5-formyltetrahydrofolate cyclo-ligase [Alkalibaculum sporogenes]